MSDAELRQAIKELIEDATETLADQIFVQLATYGTSFVKIEDGAARVISPLEAFK